MAPLAGKPPFATDEPDTFYESSPPAPQRRVRQQPPPDPNSRSSAYDMYNNYLNDNDDDRDKAGNRQSGVGALGLGLLNMDDDSDSDSDDTYTRRKPEPSPATTSSKHAALAAATAHPTRPSPPPPPPPTTQPYIAAPQPGYAAPIAALNLARPQPAAVRPQPTLHTQNLENPFESPFETPSSSPTSRHGHRYGNGAPPYSTSTSPSPSMVSSSPHPLQPPMTPITPVFARPAKHNSGVTFSDASSIASKPIVRGDKEDTLLPSRGQRGDDFWRRFSMIVKEENQKPSSQKESLWLKKTRDGTMRLSRWVWIIGIILLICVGAAIGIGWYVSHQTPDHQQPTAFGGSANEAAVATSTAGVKGSVLPNGETSSLKHVSPTHTVARRLLPTASPRISAVHKSKRRLRH